MEVTPPKDSSTPEYTDPERASRETEAKKAKEDAAELYAEAMKAVLRYERCAGKKFVRDTPYEADSDEPSIDDIFANLSELDLEAIVSADENDSHADKRSFAELDDVPESDPAPDLDEAARLEKKRMNHEEFVEYWRVHQFDKVASRPLRKEQVIEVLQTFSDREKEVLKLRFGLEDGKARTLEEVCQLLNVPRERVRQIETKAYRKTCRTAGRMVRLPSSDDEP